MECVIIFGILLVLVCTTKFYTLKLALDNKDRLEIKRKNNKLLSEGGKYSEWFKTLQNIIKMTLFEIISILLFIIFIITNPLKSNN